MGIRFNIIIYINILKIKVVHIQITIPKTVGKIKDIIVHFQLPVSFFIVNKVVLQGKCSKVKIITLIAVKIVHPFCIRIFPIA